MLKVTVVVPLKIAEHEQVIENNSGKSLGTYFKEGFLTRCRIKNYIKQSKTPVQTPDTLDYTFPISPSSDDINSFFFFLRHVSFEKNTCVSDCGVDPMAEYLTYFNSNS